MDAKSHTGSRDRSALTGQGRSDHAGKLPRGYGAMRDVSLDIDPRIDLTEPIYEQVLALEKADKEAADRG